LDVNQGSTVAVRNTEQKMADWDQSVIRNKAAREAYGYRMQSAMDLEQANIDQFAAKNAVMAGDIGAASSILGGIGSVSSKWLQAKSAGVDPFGGMFNTGT
jgi:hypothetical protein